MRPRRLARVDARPLNFTVRRLFLMSWQPHTPLEFIAFFVALWIVVSLSLSLIGGWWTLAARYRLDGTFDGKKWYMCSASFRRFVGYSGVLTMGANARGLYLAAWVPFRLGHPPLLIPWQDVRRSKNNRFSIINVALELGGDSPVRVSINKSLVRRFEEVLGHELPTAV